MNLIDKVNSIEELHAMFNAVQIGVLLLDTSYKVVLKNELAANILGTDANDPTKNEHCFSLLCSRDEVCEQCPVAASEGEIPKAKSYSLKKANGQTVLIKANYHIWEDYTVLTLNDVTREVTLLKKIDLTRKEAEAKNIILTRRCEKSKDELSSIKKIVDHLPEALVTVDSVYEIERTNNALSEIFPDQSAFKCYELFGLDFPCENCPAEKGFDFAHNFKKSHSANGKYYTELILKSGKGGMLLFTDTTRQIQLIEQIRNQQSTMSGLIDLAAKMQTEENIEDVLTYFLDTFLQIVLTESAALIVDEVRAGSIWVDMNRGLNDDTMGKITRAYLSRDVQSSANALLPQGELPWESSTQVPLMGGQGRRVGFFAIPGEYSTEIKEKIKLFTEPLGAYVHNQLLLKQLEEKANTDPMTGLYNRGFLERVLDEEKEKFHKYGIHYSLAVADVNMLKKANDNYGHEAGDLLIKTVADLLNQAVRKTDIASRTGGDEFLIVLTDSTDEAAQQFIERLKEKVFNEVYIEVGDDKEQFPVRVSLGAAGTDCFPPEKLNKEADFRMYADKEEYYKTVKKYR